MILFASVLLSSCRNKEEISNSNLTIKLNVFPQELNELGENVSDLFRISITLQNITTKKNYHYDLDNENEYCAKTKLDAGIYKISYIYSNEFITGISADVNEKEVEIKNKEESVLKVYIENKEEFIQRCNNLKPLDEILEADKYSRIVQFKGVLISLENIMESISIRENSIGLGTIMPYESKIVNDMDSGVTVTLQNQTNETLSWDECVPIKIRFENNNVIFGKGIKMTSGISEVCHSEKGLYGLPDKFDGNILLTYNLDNTSAIYIDETSGDKLTLDFDAGGNYIRSIVYEFIQ